MTDRQGAAAHSGDPQPWSWIPSLYFAEGLPYVVVMSVSVIMYKRLGISNTDIAIYTSWLNLPWILKPLWSPLLEIFGTRRAWILAMQLLVGAGLAGVALTLPADDFFRYSLAFLFLIAFGSATHDIAADGFYILGLSKHQQAWFVGFRSTFYRLAMIAGQGLLVMLAGKLEGTGGPDAAAANIPLAWSLTFYLMAGIFLLLAAYHWKVLPAPAADQRRSRAARSAIVRDFIATFALFFRKRHIGHGLAFLLLYRFAESQLLKMAAPFLLDTRSAGGLAMTTTEVGFAYGTLGLLMLVAGGIAGGVLAAQNGLKHWIPWMALAINLPNAVYVVLSVLQPGSIPLVTAAVGLEQLGYGFGFTAYMLYMLYLAQGEHSTAHFAICTGFMALGMMLPGMVSGWLQEALGYPYFFAWVLAATIPSFLVALWAPVDADFGRKDSLEEP